MAAIPVDPREELERLERKHAENPEGRYFVPLADAHRRSGNISGAIDLLRAGLTRHPDYLSAHIVLGRCYADSGEAEAAEAEFRHVLSLDPQNLIALGTLGDIALTDGRRREAERWYQDLLAVDPMNDDARAALARLTADAAGAYQDEDVQIGATEGDLPLPVTEGTDFEQPVPEKYPLEDGVAQMDLRSDDDRGAFFDDDSDVVVTETIAELYTRQGFYDRAAGVYRELIRRRGGDEALEARLRRVEALASGLPEPDDAAPTSDGITPTAPELPAEGPAVPALDDESADINLATPFYPLIGPVGGPESQDVDELLPDDQGEDEAFVAPAYDFASPIGDEPGPSESGYDDLDDLLIGPYSDPFGTSGPTSDPDLSARSFASAPDRPNDPARADFGSDLPQDPFAESFAEGFPLLDDDGEAAQAGEAIPIAGIPDLGDEETPSAAPSSGLTIGAFLRSVATWKRGAPAPEADVWEPAAADEAVTDPVASEIGLPTSEALEEPTDDPATEPPLETVTTGWDLADIAFDSALGHTPSDVAPDPLPEAVPVEPSGADDLQLLDVDDLFPWEIPVSAPAPAPSVEPLDLDPGYPFDDVPAEPALPAEDSLHAERVPSEAVDPGPAAEAAPPVAEAPAGEPEAAGPDSPLPYDLDGVVAADAPPSTPASTQDDDDLESFQAWLRSLKR